MSPHQHCSSTLQKCHWLHPRCEMALFTLQAGYPQHAREMCRHPMSLCRPGSLTGRWGCVAFWNSRSPILLSFHLLVWSLGFYTFSHWYFFGCLSYCYHLSSFSCVPVLSFPCMVWAYRLLQLTNSFPEKKSQFCTAVNEHRQAAGSWARATVVTWCSLYISQYCQSC